MIETHSIPKKDKLIETKAEYINKQKRGYVIVYN